MTWSIPTTPASARIRALVTALSILLADVGRVAAQDTTIARRDGWIVGGLIGVPGLGSGYDLDVFTLGVGITRLVPNRPGLDFAIGTIPTLIPEGVLPIGMRIGPSVPLALSRDAFIIPSAGLSGVGAVSADGGGAIAGYYWGAAVVVARGSFGVRAGATWHRPPGGRESARLLELGVMHVPTPRRRN